MPPDPPRGSRLRRSGVRTSLFFSWQGWNLCLTQCEPFVAVTYNTDWSLQTSYWCYFLSGYPHRKLGERATAVFPIDLQQKVSFGIHSHLGVTKYISNERQVGYAFVFTSVKYNNECQNTDEWQAEKRRHWVTEAENCLSFFAHEKLLGR